jgi:hypothetical protein
MNPLAATTFACISTPWLAHNYTLATHALANPLLADHLFKYREVVEFCSWGAFVILFFH